MAKQITWTDPAKADLRAIDQTTALHIPALRFNLTELYEYHLKAIGVGLGHSSRKFQHSALRSVRVLVP